MKSLIIIVQFFLLNMAFLLGLSGQSPFKKIEFGTKGGSTVLPAIQSDILLEPNPYSGPKLNFETKHFSFGQLAKALGQPIVLEKDENGRPVAISYHKKIEGNIKERGNVHNAVQEFLGDIASELHLDHPENQFEIVSEEWDELGMLHIRMRQVLDGIPVYGGEIMLHGNEEGLNYFNGHYYTNVLFSKRKGTQISKKHAIKIVSDLEGVNLSTIAKEPKSTSQGERIGIQLKEPTRTQLMYFFYKDRLVLTWHLDYYTSAIDHWSTFVDARTGGIIKKVYLTCSLDGNTKSHAIANSKENSELKLVAPPPSAGDRTATGRDLNGKTQTIHVWNQDGKNYLLDASKSMYNAGASRMPEEPIGALITLDAGSTHPQNQNFEVGLPFSEDNRWGPLQISAHYNGSVAYEYYRQVHARNSINGQGGNIISIYNVSETDGGGMDNAFWSGKAMFYGNGRNAYNKLAGGLDVAGHEMTHGVIGATANLNYEGESGAINESMADVFGTMIDREDWQLGEDVVKRSAFPSGFLRDMSDPHNGGSRLGDPGWQPRHVNEQYHGEQDNGGVHINSGIPNYAYYLFVQNMAKRVGEANAKKQGERIYYRALSRYLTRSSQFVDLRAAIIKSAQDLYGSQEVEDAKNAFAAVGIGSGGSTGGNGKLNDLPINPGTWFFLANDKDYNSIFLFNLGTQNQPDELFNQGIRSKVSMTDNGALGVFVGNDKKIYGLQRQSNGGYQLFIVDDKQPWRNAVISKDGNSLALLGDSPEPSIFVWSFVKSEGVKIDLYNPTTADGVEAGDVQYAEAMEFDHSGEYILYDALSRIRSSTGANYEYWDIGFVHVWDNNTRDWGSGKVSKLISDLPEKVSIGNPVFSKNSPYVIAFDILDQRSGTDQYAVLGANIETGEIGSIFQNSELGFPNYSIDDKNIVFNASDQSGNPVLGLIGVESNKIKASGDASIFLDGGRWGVFFADGQRNLQIKTKDIAKDQPKQFLLLGNPVNEELNIKYIGNDKVNSIDMKIVDRQGKVLVEDDLLHWAKDEVKQIPVSTLKKGIYIIELNNFKIQERLKWVK